MNDLCWQKIFSGQFVFTCVTAFVFGYAACNKILTAEQDIAIIMLVVGFYFNRSKGGTNAPSVNSPAVPAVTDKPSER